MVFNRILLTVASLLSATCLAESVVLISPDPKATGTEIAVVWIQGANYNAGQYT